MREHSRISRKRLPIMAGLIASTCLGYAAQSLAVQVEIGGHLNVTASQSDTGITGGESEKVSDVFVNSLELGLTISPLRNADVNVVWLLEEEPAGGSPDQGFAVDQAFVTLSGTGRMLADTPDRQGLEDSPWYLQAGKLYVPFSTNFEYHTFDVISEPDTLGLGETLETSLLLGFSPGPINVYGGIYGGRGADGNAGATTPGEDADDELNDMFLGIAGEFDRFTVAVNWMSNLNNSITLIDELDPTEDAVAGLDLYGSITLGPATLQLNYVSAMDSYTQGGLADLQPMALWGELTFGGLMLGNREWTITGLFGQTDEWPGHPETTYGIVIDVALFDGVTLSGEYLRREFDATLSSPLDTEDLFALQLSTEFGALIGGM